MRRTFVLPAVLAAATALSACDRKAPPPPASAPEAEAPADDGYLASPSVTGSTLQGGVLTFVGKAEPGARVRLAPPVGGALFTDADAAGRWRIQTPAERDPRTFGLSMTARGRQIQAQGYILADSSGAATQLRAGAGALRLNARGKPRIITFDYDREGGAVASGLAPPGASVSVRVDGAALGEGRADAEGRFSIPITQPVSQGQHRVQIQGDSFQGATTVEVEPAAPLVDGPFRSRLTPSALRADWMTPGGGVQTTLIMD